MMGYLVVGPFLILGSVVAWLFAEFRGGRRARIGLGALCMVNCFLWFGSLVDHSMRGILYGHLRALRGIDRKLSQGEVPAVRRAIRSYEKAFEETESFKRAVLHLEHDLAQQ